MISTAALKLRMYITLILSFAIGFAIIYALLLYMGLSTYYIMAFAVLFFLFQWYASPYILAKASRIHYIKDDEYPQLHTMVKELAVQAGVPEPKIAIAPVKEPNAFVFGRSRKSATLVVHEGLLPLLDAKELRAVLAHEIGHLRHNDVVVMTVVAFIPMLAYIVAQSMLWSGMWGEGRNNGSYILLFGLLAFVVYFIAELLVLSLSRTRESFADEYSATSTKKPEYLASALFKITSSNAGEQNASRGSTVARSLYIIDFFSAEKDADDIKKNASAIRKLVPQADIEDLVKKAHQGRQGIFGVLGALLATHPSTYRRIVELARIKEEQNY